MKNISMQQTTNFGRKCGQNGGQQRNQLENAQPKPEICQVESVTAEQSSDKQKRRCDIKCQQHQFELRNSMSQKYDIDVLFCPKYHRVPRKPQKTFPVFNNDKKYYTSGFILPLDKNALQINEKQEIAEHSKQIKQSQQKNGQIVFPRPHKKHFLCAVCKTKYNHYYKHIMSLDHKNKIVENQYNLLILAMQAKFQHLHLQLAPSPIQIIDIHKASEEQGRDGREQEPEKEAIAKAARQQVINTTQITQIIPNQIIQLIISSDSQDEESIKLIEKFSQNQQSSPSVSEPSLNSSEQPQSKEKQVYNINVDSDESNSVQIISVKHVNKDKSSKKIKKSKKKSKSHKHKIKKQKKDKKRKKDSKNKKNKKNKNKKKSKSKKSSSSSESQEQSANIKRRGSVGKKGPQLLPEVRKPTFRKWKEAHPPQKKHQEVLIQKSQINDPQLETQMQKILSNIVGGIKNGPPAQPRRKYQKTEVSQSRPPSHVHPSRQFKTTPGPINEDRRTYNQSDRSGVSGINSRAVVSNKSTEISKGSTNQGKQSKTNELMRQILQAKGKSQLMDNDVKDNKIFISPSKQVTNKYLFPDAQNGSKVRQRDEIMIMPSKRHLGDGMLVTKVFAQGLIDLDNQPSEVIANGNRMRTELPINKPHQSNRIALPLSQPNRTLNSQTLRSIDKKTRQSNSLTAPQSEPQGKFQQIAEGSFLNQLFTQLYKQDHLPYSDKTDTSKRAGSSTLCQD